MSNFFGKQLLFTVVVASGIISSFSAQWVSAAVAETPNYNKTISNIAGEIPWAANVLSDLNFYKGGNSAPAWAFNEMVIQADGRPVISTLASVWWYSARTFVRYNLDGTIDPTFIAWHINNSERVDAMGLQNDGKILVAGFARMRRLYPNWQLDTWFTSPPRVGASWIGGLTVIQWTNDGKILFWWNPTVEHAWVIYRGLIRLHDNWTVDSTFRMGGTWVGFPVWSVTAAVELPDWKIMVAWNFSTVWGLTYNNLVRLNSDGSVDTLFANPWITSWVEDMEVDWQWRTIVVGAFNTVYRFLPNWQRDMTFRSLPFNVRASSIWIQSDGKIVLGWQFTIVSWTSFNRIVRLNTDGNIDTTFLAWQWFNAQVWLWGWPANWNALNIWPNDSIYVWGTFTRYDGYFAPYFVRIQKNWAIHPSFVQQKIDTFNAPVNKIVKQNDGKILVWGNFNSFSALPRNTADQPGLIRMNKNGTVDSGFSLSGGFNGGVFEILPLDNGKIYIWWAFSTLNWVAASRIVRLNNNGSRDVSFNMWGGFNDVVYTIKEQSDGKIYVWWNFTSYSWSAARYLVRLHPDGRIDNTFSLPAWTWFNGGWVRDIEILPSGKILVAGGFWEFNGQTLSRIAVFNTDGALDTSFIWGNFNESNVITKVLVETDGKIVFVWSAPAWGTNIVIRRLLPNWDLDRTFTVAPLWFWGKRATDIVKTKDNDYIVAWVIISRSVCCDHTAEWLFRLKNDGSYDYTFDIGKWARVNPTSYTAWAWWDVSTIELDDEGWLLVWWNFTSFWWIPQEYFTRVILPPIWERTKQGPIDMASIGWTDANRILGRNHTMWWSLSPNGRYVTFLSRASNLVQWDTNNATDVFVRDTILGNTIRVNISNTWFQANSGSTTASISNDWRYVVFDSDATNLVPWDTNNMRDVFVRDLQLNITTRVSVWPSWEQWIGWNPWIYTGTPRMSPDWRYIVFGAPFTNWFANDTNNAHDVYIRDTIAWTTRQASVNTSWVPWNGASFLPQVSDDWRYVSMVSAATNLFTWDASTMNDIYIKDLLLWNVIRASVWSAWQVNANDIIEYSMNSNGRYVAFSTRFAYSTWDTNGANDILRRDTLTNATVRVSVGSSWEQWTGNSAMPILTPDGTKVIFWSTSINFTTWDTNAVQDVFLKDIDEWKIIRAGMTYLWLQPKAAVTPLGISADWATILVSTNSDNMLYWDSNRSIDVFTIDVGKLEASLLTYTAPDESFTFKYPRTFQYKDIAGRGSLVTLFTPVVEKWRINVWSSVFYVTKGNASDSSDVLYAKTTNQMRKIFRWSMTVRSELVKTENGNIARIVKYRWRIARVQKEYTVAVLRDAWNVYVISANADATKSQAMEDLVDTAVKTWSFAAPQ
jgi:uncharacterized delta-60 repeat protein